MGRIEANDTSKCVYRVGGATHTAERIAQRDQRIEVVGVATEKSDQQVERFLIPPQATTENRERESRIRICRERIESRIAAHDYDVGGAALASGGHWHEPDADIN